MSMMIFSKTVLKNLFSKPVTTAYPAVPASFKERTRGHIEFDAERCVLCTLCAKRCPVGVITVDRNEKLWAIDRFGCVQCGNCVNACRKGALSLVPGYIEPQEHKSVDRYVKEEPQHE